MSKKKIFLILLLILLLLAAAAAAAYYFYYLPQQQQKAGESGQEPGPTTTEFTGQYVKGEAPEDWTVVEYKNGEGSEILAEVPYIGLTGLEIKNPSGSVIFKLGGVDGIGGAGGCATYFQFSDDSLAYLTEIKETRVMVDEPPPMIVDLTDVTYQEYELFGVRVRRVETKLYWDTDPGEIYFEAGCGISENIFIFETLSFNSLGDYQYTVSAYHYTLNEGSSEAELLELDAILESLVTL